MRRDSVDEDAAPATWPAWGQFLFRNRGWLVVLLLILVVSIVRIRLRTMPLERDEGEYAYAGQLMLSGVPPYKLAFNMKLPGTYAAYAMIMAVFGQSAAGIRIGLLLVNAATIAMVFALGRKLLDQTAGMAAASVYALCAMSPTVLGLAGHATHFVVAFALAGTLLLLRAIASQRSWTVFVAGLLFGIAFLMKQHGILYAAFAGIYLCWTIYEKAGFNLRKLLSSAGFLVLGFLLPYAATCLWLTVSGVFHQFVFWTMSYAGRYVSAVPAGEGPAQFRSSVHQILGSDPWLWILSALAAVVMWWERRLEGRRLFLTAFTLASIAAVCAGFYFRAHYFILLLPALALLGGIGVSRGVYLLKHDKTIELFLGVAMLLIFAIGIVVAMVEFGPVWFDLSPVEASKRIYASSVFNQAATLASQLQRESPPAARVAVLGSEPEIYFYSKRRSVTGYIYMYPLMETHDFALKMQEELIHDIESNQPDYLVYVDDEYSWVRRENSEKKLDAWWENFRARYDLVQTYEISTDLSDGRGAANFGSDNEPKLERALILYKRRS
jgi:hypothetical protein